MPGRTTGRHGRWRNDVEYHEAYRVVPMKELLITLLLMLLVPPEPMPIGAFECTAYCSCEKCCGAWADGITYTGVQATANRTIAVDPDVIPLGSEVIINGQAYVAEDVGGAIQGNRIDIYMDSHSEALKWGVQQHVVYPAQ